MNDDHRRALGVASLGSCEVLEPWSRVVLILGGWGIRKPFAVGEGCWDGVDGLSEV